MAFIETRFPDDISYGATGGPGFQTDVIVVNSGHEQRNAAWEDARGMWDVSHGVRSAAQLATLIAFFRVMKGRANGFRFKDHQDFKAESGEGIFRTLSATTFQMVKRYTLGGSVHDRDIKKPVAGTVLVTGGSGVSVDTTTGIVTVTSGTPTAWTGEFDVPARFDTDQMRTSIIAYNTHSWGQIPVVEIRV
ncbi:MAG TPA: DUF2460 domain-containing protein [Candidatus Desulfobacillus denitrificans]|nr:DUF2460 domain-containing protein [Candidatus Desulfobacillus denitrificans]